MLMLLFNKAVLFRFEIVHSEDQLCFLLIYVLLQKFASEKASPIFLYYDRCLDGCERFGDKKLFLFAIDVTIYGRIFLREDN